MRLFESFAVDGLTGCDLGNGLGGWKIIVGGFEVIGLWLKRKLDKRFKRFLGKAYLFICGFYIL